MAISWLLVTGVIQLIIGSFCFTLGVIEAVAVNRKYFRTFTSFMVLAAWLGFGIAITGVLGILAKVKSSKGMISVYLGFSIASICLAIAMLGSYITNLFLKHLFGGIKAMSALIVILSFLEVGIGIWASFCCGQALGCCSCMTESSHLTVEQIEKLIYMQLQAGGPPIANIFIQGPDGNPVAVPTQTGSEPMIEQSGIPPSPRNDAELGQVVYLQTQDGGPLITYVIIQGPGGNPVAVLAQNSGPVVEQSGIPTSSSNAEVPTIQDVSQTRQNETRGHSHHTVSYV